MICDHSTLTDIVLPENKFVLVYCGDTLIAAEFVVNNVTSSHTVEILDSAQDIIDRGLALGLKCTTDHLLTSMEYGAVLPADVLAYMLSYIWDEDDRSINRMEALGYTQP